MVTITTGPSLPCEKTFYSVASSPGLHKTPLFPLPRVSPSTQTRLGLLDLASTEKPNASFFFKQELDHKVYRQYSGYDRRQGRAAQ